MAGLQEIHFVISNIVTRNCSCSFCIHKCQLKSYEELALVPLGNESKGGFCVMLIFTSIKY